jgi:hypothetical protein
MADVTLRFVSRVADMPLGGSLSIDTDRQGTLELAVGSGGRFQERVCFLAKKGRSPKTYQALLELMQAMAEDLEQEKREQQQTVDLEPIPEGIYYSEGGDNFYLTLPPHSGQGTLFYEKWISRKDEFPRMWDIFNPGKVFVGWELGSHSGDAFCSYSSRKSVPLERLAQYTAVKR